MQNPYLSAVAAIAYIALIVTCLMGLAPTLEPYLAPFFAPLFMLSLLVLSVAVMAFLFFFRPVTLMLEHAHREAFGYFIRMLATFAVLIVGMVAFAGFVRFTLIGNDTYCRSATGDFVPCAQVQRGA